MSWKEAAAAVHWNIQPFIDGRYRSSTATECFDNVNPANETVLCQAAVGSAAEVDAAVSVARRRFEEGCWSGLPPIRRAEVLIRLADLIVRRKEEFALLDVLEMGKPIQAALSDVESFAPMLLRSAAGFADKLTGESAPLSAHALALNTYQPRGVVGAITPWNFPIVNALFKVAPALAAGNTLVLKPSELASSSALKLAELALEAGVPPGVLNVVPGLGSTVGSALALHPDVDLLSFTGSTTTGRRIMELAGRSNGKPVMLECGGKSPQVVFDDVGNLDRIASEVIGNVLWNSGQVCSAHTRVIVHHAIREALVEKLVRLASRSQPGDPLSEQTTLGPLASPVQRDRVKRYVGQGLTEGAEPVLRGRIQESGGCHVAPTIFDRVERTMSIAREEIFGPVLCVQGFATEAEAISLANDTEYGLFATVWTGNAGRGRRLAHAIRAGHIAVRTSGEEGPESGCLLSYEPQKASGFGAELGLDGLKSYSTLKVVSFTGA